jgi:uncharacterized protein
VKESRYNTWVERDGQYYVHNGVSGALLRVSAQDYTALRRFLDGEAVHGCQPSFLLDLVQGRMLLGDDADELAFLARRYADSRHGSDHLALTLVTSLGCNFACPYCFEDKHASTMDAAVQDAIVDLVRDRLPVISAFTVDWFGGEPLMGKQALLALSDRFLSMCSAAGVNFRASLTTNGYLLDEKTCEELSRRRVGSAQVSLDGPPQIHDRMRPLANGRGTFARTVRNLRHAVDYFKITIRINVDRGNIGSAEELLQLLAAEGLSGKLRVYLGQLIEINDGSPAPSVSYAGCCLTKPEFAQAELDFARLATRYGFDSKGLPSPRTTPCTAVRENDLVIGSEGELYKCYLSVGNPNEVIGNIRDYRNTNSRVNKWLAYKPYENAECCECIALPVCMGGCAHHAFDAVQYENRCGTFRHNHKQVIIDRVDAFNAPERSAVPAATLNPAKPRFLPVIN